MPTVWLISDSELETGKTAASGMVCKAYWTQLTSISTGCPD